MKKYSILLLLTICVVIVSTTACSSSAHVKIGNTPYVDLNITLLPAGVLENSLKKMSSSSGVSSLFHDKEIRKSFTSQGIMVQDLQLIGFCGLKLNCSIPHGHSLLKKMLHHDTAKKTVALRVSQSTVRELLALIPEDNRDFVDILMAPIITGEKISVQEYRETIATIYGAKMAVELERSVFTVILETPYTIHTCSVKPVGTVTAQKQPSGCVTAVIPLADLLCMTDTLTIEMQGR